MTNRLLRHGDDVSGRALLIGLTLGLVIVWTCGQCLYWMAR